MVALVLISPSCSVGEEGGARGARRAGVGGVHGDEEVMQRHRTCLCQDRPRVTQQHDDSCETGGAQGATIYTA